MKPESRCCVVSLSPNFYIVFFSFSVFFFKKKAITCLFRFVQNIVLFFFSFSFRILSYFLCFKNYFRIFVYLGLLVPLLLFFLSLKSFFSKCKIKNGSNAKLMDP